MGKWQQQFALAADLSLHHLSSSRAGKDTAVKSSLSPLGLTLCPGGLRSAQPCRHNLRQPDLSDGPGMNRISSDVDDRHDG